MSLILEALRKSEAERRRGQAPGLFVEQVRVPVRRSARTPAWAWGLMLLLAGVLVAWGWREFGMRAPASMDTATGGSSSDGSATSRSIAPTTAPAAGDPQRVEAASASPDAAPRTTDAANEPAATMGADDYGRDAAPDIAAAEHAQGFETEPARGAQIAATTLQDTPRTAPANTGVANDASDTGPASRGTANSPSGSTSANAAVAVSERGHAPATASTTQRPAPTSSAPATTPANPSPAAASSLPPVPMPEDEYLPRLSELTGDERSGLPALKLSMHVYAEDPAQRFVIVDGRRLREGDSPAAGIAVESIRRDGLVLSVNGRRVLLARP